MMKRVVTRAPKRAQTRNVRNHRAVAMRLVVLCVAPF